MTGLIVTLDKEEIQAVDEGNFEEIVVEVIDSFFDSVEGYKSVEVEWKAGDWDFGSQYKITEPPTQELLDQRYHIQIEGQSRGGQYGIEIGPSGFYIQISSTGQKKQLDYITLRAPEVAVNTRSEEIFVKEIPKQIRKRVVKSIPKIGESE